MKPLTHLEDATLRFVLANAGETNGWLDLTRVSSNTGRMLPDVRQAVARLTRRGLLVIDENATNTQRWIRFVLPKESETAVPEGPAAAGAVRDVAPAPLLVASRARAVFAGLAAILWIVLPSWADAVQEGEAAAARGDWGQAAEHYLRALEAEPALRPALLGLARAVVEADLRELVDRCEAALRARQEANAADLDLRQALGELLLFRAGYVSENHLREAVLARATAHFAAVVEGRPEREEAAVGLARSRHAEGAVEEAIQVLDAYLGRDPDEFAAALLWKGRILYEAARAKHDEEGGGFPLSQEVRRLYARGQGAALSSAAAAPKSFDAWMVVAWTSQVLGDRETALQGYEGAYAIDPESPLPLQGITVLLQGDEEAYAAAIERLKRHDPERRRVRLLEGHELVQEGKVDEAIRFFEGFLEDYAEDADALYELGKLHETKKHDATAVELYERALRSDGSHAHAAEELDRRLRAGAIARAKESLESARKLIADYRGIMDLAPSNPYVRNNVAFALREGWKAHQTDSSWRSILLLSVRAYEDAADIIGPWHPDKKKTLPWGRRFGYAQIVNDTGVMFHLFAPIRDLQRAEMYYARALDYVDGGYLDAWTYLRKIYEEQARWGDLHALALRCAGGLAAEDGAPYESHRKLALKVAQDLVDQGLVPPK